MKNQKVQSKMPLWYWILSLIFLIWNLFGLAVFLSAMFIFTSREALENAGLNEAQIELTLSTPAWVNVAFGVAVIFGVLGCAALLARSRFAVPILFLSLLGVLAQNAYMYLLSDTIKIMGVGASPMVIAGAILLIPFSILGVRRGWLS